MTISIEQLNERKTKLAEDFNTVSKRIEDGEKEIETLKNNRNALAGAIQQVNLFLQELQPDEVASTGTMILNAFFATASVKGVFNSSISPSTATVKVLLFESTTT